LQIKHWKSPAIAIAGNILDYYDFLLFVHLGHLLLPLFMPLMSDKQSHLLSLFLFGIIFLVRPIGAYLIGRISDLIDRKKALSLSVLWAAIATMGLALLPTYDSIGITATLLLIGFRILQGMSVGGEYPTAGTFLMESYPKHRGLLSGLLSASSSLGSLLAFVFAWFCLKEGSPDWLWRVAFLLGGIASLASYLLRKNLSAIPALVAPQEQLIYPRHIAMITTLLLGMLISIFSWLPTTYTYFYFTKILYTTQELALAATFIAIILQIILKPILGMLSTRFQDFSYYVGVCFLSVPLILLGFYWVTQGQIKGQIPLVIVAAMLSAPVHSVMNRLFAKENRSRSVNLLFILGACMGGLAPALLGFVVDKTGYHFFPAIFCVAIVLISGGLLTYFSYAYHTSRC